MAVPFRQQFPVLLALLAVAVHFSPELTVDQKSIGTSALWLAAMLLNLHFSPKAEPDQKLPRIIWDERDEGEKFTIIMFHLLISVGAFFLAYQMAERAFAMNGDGWVIIPALLVVASTIWFLWSNWKNRNAR